MKKKEHEELKERVILLFKEYHSDDKRVVDCSEKITNYKGNKFFTTLSNDIKEILKNEPISAEWLVKFFFYTAESTLSEKYLERLEHFCDQVEKIILSKSENLRNIPSDKKIEDSLSDYFKHLVKQHQFIKIGIVGLSFPINKLVRLSLKKQDIQLQTKINQLEEKLINLQKNNQDTSEIKTHINTLLEEDKKAFDIVELINSNDDIFIHSPAGHGKTTLLRWLTYGLAGKFFHLRTDTIPILIELKFDKPNLEEYIKSSLSDDHSLEELNTLSKQIVLLIDGFDEFEGNSSEFITDLKKFKEQTSAKIIFTGRNKPNNLEKLDLIFTTYNLNTFSLEDVKFLFKEVLTEHKDEFFQKLEELELSELLQTPLYLMLLLSYLKENIQYDFDVKQINLLLLNKGAFLKRVLIEEFILHYEIKRNETSLDSKEYKQTQILLMSYLAYYFTVELNDQQAAKKVDIIKAIDTFKRNHSGFNDISSYDLLDDFLHHNILQKSIDQIGFEKKEIRYFFTALYLNDKIKNRKGFNHFRNLIKSKNESSEVEKNAATCWANVEAFLIGIIDPDKLINENLRILHKGTYIFSQELIEQLELCIKLIALKKYPTRGVLRKEEDIVKLAREILTFPQIAKNEFKGFKHYYLSLMLKLPYLSFLQIIVYIFSSKRYPAILLNKKLIEICNKQYLMGYVTRILIANLVTSYDINFRLGQVRSILKELGDDYLASIVSQYTFYKHNNSKVVFPQHDISELTYDTIYTRDFATSEDSYATSYPVLKFVKDSFKYSPIEFIEFYFSRQTSPSSYHFDKFIDFCSNIPGHGIWSINIESLSKKTIISLTDVTIHQIINTSEKSRHISLDNFIKLFTPKFFEEIFDTLFEMLNDSSSDKETQQRAFSFLARYPDPGDEDYYVGYNLLKCDNEAFTKRTIISLTYLVSPFFGKVSTEFKWVDREMNILLGNESTPKETKDLISFCYHFCKLSNKKAS